MRTAPYRQDQTVQHFHGARLSQQRIPLTAMQVYPETEAGAAL